MGNQPWPQFQNGIRERPIVKLIKSPHSQGLFRTKNRTFDFAVEVFICSICIVLRTKLLSHDLNTFWCV